MSARGALEGRRLIAEENENIRHVCVSRGMNEETIKSFLPRFDLGLFSRTFCKALLGPLFHFQKVWALILGLLVAYA